VLDSYLEKASESLNDVFGTATLPDDLPPSAIPRQ